MRITIDFVATDSYTREEFIDDIRSVCEEYGADMEVE